MDISLNEKGGIVKAILVSFAGLSLIFVIIVLVLVGIKRYDEGRLFPESWMKSGSNEKDSRATRHAKKKMCSQPEQKFELVGNPYENTSADSSGEENTNVNEKGDLETAEDTTESAPADDGTPVLITIEGPWHDVPLWEKPVKSGNKILTSVPNETRFKVLRVFRSLDADFNTLNFYYVRSVDKAPDQEGWVMQDFIRHPEKIDTSNIVQTGEDVGCLRRVISELADKRNSKAVPFLQDCLKEKNPFIRKDTVNAMADIGSQNVVPILQEIVDKDPDASVRASAKLALGRLGSGKEKKQ